MGSVFKPVLAAAALEQGILPEYECTGAVVVDGQIFRCAGGVPHGTVDMTAALEKSCNGYFIRLGQQLGAETLLQMSRQLGFGQEVPVAGALYADAGKLPSAGELAQSGQLANFSFGAGRSAGITGTDRRHDEHHCFRRGVPHAFLCVWLGG